MGGAPILLSAPLEAGSSSDSPLSYMELRTYVRSQLIMWVLRSKCGPDACVATALSHLAISSVLHFIVCFVFVCIHVCMEAPRLQVHTKSEILVADFNINKQCKEIGCYNF